MKVDLKREEHTSCRPPGPLAALSRAAWVLVLFLVWALWWGGLCFYAVVVVPIGTELIGSVEQGFITQQVTLWHNGLTGIVVLCLFIEAGRRSYRVLWAAGGILAIVLVCQIAWHFHLTATMDFQHQTVPEGFYAEHAIYLWMTAIEWTIGLTMPLYLFAIPPIQGHLQAESIESGSTH